MYETSNVSKSHINHLVAVPERDSGDDVWYSVGVCASIPGKREWEIELRAVGGGGWGDTWLLPCPEAGKVSRERERERQLA